MLEGQGEEGRVLAASRAGAPRLGSKLGSTPGRAHQLLCSSRAGSAGTALRRPAQSSHRPRSGAGALEGEARPGGALCPPHPLNHPHLGTFLVCRLLTTTFSVHACPFCLSGRLSVLETTLHFVF